MLSAARILAAGSLGAAVCLFPIPASAAEQRLQPVIPFIVGLTTVRATSEPRGDYEILRVIDAISAEGYRITASAEVPADDGSGMREASIVRRVRAQDQRDARTMRSYFHTKDAEEFAGTVPGFSAAMVTDLRSKGEAAVTYLDVGTVFGMPMVRRKLVGTVARVTNGARTLPMLVNGRRVVLPVIHVRGRLSADDDSEAFEFHVLDDPLNPIVLRSRGAGAWSSLVRIEFPVPQAATRSIERELATNRSAELYGIYFAFASAALRLQSERVLKEIAAALKANPDWRLRIDGHTDGIGTEDANLDLSRRRAAAVKTALVARHGIAATRLATGGFGEARPKAGNDSSEGRARNRRVELTRL